MQKVVNLSHKTSNFNNILYYGGGLMTEEQERVFVILKIYDEEGEPIEELFSETIIHTR